MAKNLPKKTDFPEGTEFYIKEFDVPLVRMPSNEWFNWFGGKPKLYDVKNLKPGNNAHGNSATGDFEIKFRYLDESGSVKEGHSYTSILLS